MVNRLDADQDRQKGSLYLDPNSDSVPEFFLRC